MTSSRFRRLFVLSCILWACLGHTIPGATIAEQASLDRYLCWSLERVINDLRGQNLKVIYSSDLVTPDMQIVTAPRAAAPRQVLDEVLAPFGLEAKDAPGDIVLVVRPGDWRKERSGRIGPVAKEGLLPIWIDGQAGLLEWSFPLGDLPAIEAHSRFMVIELEAAAIRDLSAAAFEIKSTIVDYRSLASDLRIALDGPADTVRELVRHGLAAYVDAYLHRGQPLLVPQDATGRSWWRVEVASEGQVLSILLEGAARGDEVVILDGLDLDATHHAFLQQTQATRSALLAEQPPIEGVRSDRAHFMLDPETGDYFLAVYGSGDAEEIRFDLAGIQGARCLFPKDAPFEFSRYGDRGYLELDGAYPYYLFELPALIEGMVMTDVEVESSRIVDPYVEVVKNQVFVDREAEKFQSLDVMEYISLTPLYPGGSQIDWEHRIFQRKGKLSEFLHIGYTRNGIRYPADKLRKGRIARDEALVSLRPLEIELDETYRYEYLGEETIDGHATYRIRFEPRRKSTIEDGSFVSGIVWLDQETHAHHRKKTIQQGLDGRLISQELTYHYGWIPGENQCFWDWRYREGTDSTSYLGEQYQSRRRTERVDFRFNQPDIDEIVRDAHLSDVMIHVESPPDGHRWLVKAEGRRVLAKVDEGLFESYPAQGMPAPQIESSPEAEAEESEVSERVLADTHAFSKHVRFSMGAYGSDSFDLYPGLVLTDQDFLAKGIQAYTGLFLEEALLSLAFPNLFGRNWTLTTSLLYPYDARTNSEYRFDPDEGWKNLSVDLKEDTLSLGIGIPAGGHASLNAVYSLARLDFASRGNTDPDFSLPSDTLQHTIDLSMNLRWRSLTAEIGYEYGLRDDWQPWGLQQSEPLLDSFSVARVRLGIFLPLPRSQSLGITAGYLESWDLDRFSRFPNGRGRARQVGFGTHSGFDEAVTTTLEFNTRVFRLPIGIRVDSGHGYLLEGNEETDHRVGSSLRFLINGPFQTDIWPSIRYTLHSTVPGEEGEVTYGLSISHRR